MSGFKALNIESDDESDVEIDDTKEIQIEEALKLYQNALKYHADGPASFDQAAEAYRQLFESDIFKYPESQTELQRIELYGPSPEYDDLLDGPILGTVVTSSGLDTGPSTLPQILHLSHKNYAQLKLEALAAQFDSFNVTLNQVLADATAALNHFVQALDKDDGDLDLWRRTASVGEMLDSSRVARYCLESVLDGDDEGLTGVMSLPGLDEGFAGEQLRSLVSQLQDQLSLFQGPLSTTKRKVFSTLLKQRLHPYSDLLHREATLRSQRGKPVLPRPQRLKIKAPSTWAELGDAVLQQHMAEEHGTFSALVAPAIEFDFTGSEALPLPPKALQRASSPQVVIPRVIIPKLTAYPITLEQQFPGSDHGRPTVQPQIASADESMQIEPPSATDGDVEMDDSPTATLPSRKRSGDVAGLQEGAEEGRTKSRRIRARDSTADAAADRQAIIDANTRWEYEQQLNEFQAADDWMFETVGNLFERVGIVGLDASRHIRHEMQSSSARSSTPSPPNSASTLRLVRSDIQSFLDKWNDQLSHLLLHGGESLEIGSGSTASGTGNMFTGGGTSKSGAKLAPIPNDGLHELLSSVNNDWVLNQGVAWKFIDHLLRPGKIAPDASSYTQFQWSDNLKTMVVRTLVNFDKSIFETASAEFKGCQELRGGDSDHFPLSGFAEVVQSIFELHLDIYCLIKQPNSGVELDTITSQGDRLLRWSELAQEVMRFAFGDRPSDSEAALPLRFFWATTFNISASSDITQDHVIACMNDLKGILIAAGEPTIQLQNNAIMPELSSAALERELSKLTTKDFFLKVTNQDLSDPAAVIENLEPLLEALDAGKGSVNGDGETDGASAPPANAAPELVRFLEASPLSVRLLLWQRLRDAYGCIEYHPMIICCHLRMVGMVLEELKSANVAGMERADRTVTVLKSLRLMSEITKKMYDTIVQHKDALECIDENYLMFAVKNFGEILQLLQVFNVAEDSLRVGQSQPPSMTNGLPVPSFRSVMTLTHEMQVRIWIMLYYFLREAIAQNKEAYPTPIEDRFDFLRVVHRNLGIRGICSSLNRAFVRMLKDEFFQMTHVDGYDSEQAQVLYDLYGLNCFLNPSHDLIEHHCTKDAFLDRGVALQAVDLLLAQAGKLPIRELVKHPLKDTIDKVHGAMSRKRPTDAVLRNRDIYRNFLRSPINPLDLFSCLTGEGNQLPVTPIPEEDVVLASKGWYFLMGHIALTKFRSQKRSAPTPTEDVDIAIAFFNQDLEVTVEHWETWFRLAQAYDTKIEENVVWSAEKLNNNMPDIITLQRSAIHCFTMALALAHRSADLQFETSSKMTELYHDFAMRLYASSRAPFDMKPFDVEDVEIFISSNYGVHKEKPFKPLREYTAWKLANVLFQRAIPGKSDHWQLHYMIGKCLWKMHSADQHTRGHDKPPSGEQVLNAFIRALELLPDKDKKESKDSKKEPVLEPHYKLFCIVHKLVTKGSITLERAKEALQITHYARKETFPESMRDWVPYVLAVLKYLRSADKSNWYHRMIARHAQIVYDIHSTETDETGQNLGALAAKSEFTAQMFTKTMVLQVWKPDNERAGRHFVYTSRYTLFFIKILKQLKDRTSLEMLARRVRRRPHDLFQHSHVWSEICTAYLQLLRSFANLQEGLETSTFSNIAHEEFLVRKEPLERWMQMQDAGVSPALDVLREVQELKKINQSLMKPGAIDDLIGDSYAHIFNTIGKQLWDDEQRVKREEEARNPPPQPQPQHASPPRNPMMSMHHIMNLVDGASDAQPVAQLPQLVTAGAALVREADIVPTRRKIGVGRREIRTCSESCFQKSKPGATPVLPSNAPPLKSSVVQGIIDRDRLTEASSGVASVETSAPASIHDDADDESELSELEEEEGEGEGDDANEGASGRRATFPGLASINGKAQGRVEEGDDEGEGDEEDEGEGDELVQEDVEMQE